jgi:2,3-bisphosphoglycerate-independent phosphoglycerate mutase
MDNSNAKSPSKRPAVLCILDGWGQRAARDNNAIALADTPNWDRMVEAWPMTLLACSGEDVGLPDGQMGNSEVGHMNLGAGRVIWQDLPRINNAIADGSLAGSAELKQFISALLKTSGTCHLMGLISPGGVHSHQDHVVALADIVGNAGVPVKIHGFLDGRDMPPTSGAECAANLRGAIAGMENVSIATLCGRYFAMDRDNRWDRVERAYDLIVSADGQAVQDPVAAIRESYETNVTDEFLEPIRSENYEGMRDGDGILHANFRADRVRELLASLVDPGFDGFERDKTVAFAARLGMVAYSDHLNAFCDVIFSKVRPHNTLGEVVSKAGLTQVRMAETEKYPHVTFFFNGGREEPFTGEERVLVPSPKVATYDLKPEMSAAELTEKLVNAIRSRRFDLVVVNYANGDMVGHTGSLDAAMAAARCVDTCLAQVEAAVIEADGVMLVTADHGNCEMMVDPETGGPHTAHTLNPTPTLLVNAKRANVALASGGRLADVAPTLLDLMGLDQPAEMTGRSLLRAASR